MSRLVAEIRRKLTFTGRLEPTGSISPSCSARSSLTWASSGSSPTSSRNSVPPSASWNLPMRRSTAPVNEPFSWPNSVDSTRFSGIAPQLTVMNGLACALALALDGAGDQLLADAGFAFDQHRDVRGRRALAERDDALHGIAADDQIVERQRAFGALLDAGDLAGQRLDLQRRAHRDLEPLGARRLDHEVDRAGAHGVDRGVDRAVGGEHDDRVACRPWPAMPFSTAMPSVPGITRSRRTRLIEPFSGPSRNWRAWSPEIAVLASKPNRLTVSSRIRRWAGSSSTMSTRLGM